MKNIGQHILERSIEHESNTALRFKREGSWQQLTYKQFAQQIRELAAGLMQGGICTGDRVGIFSQNSPEWIIADYATMSIGAVTVPLYATTSREQVISIVNNSQMRIIFVGDQKQLEVIESIKSECTYLETVVTMNFRAEVSHYASFSFNDLLLPNVRDFENDLSKRKMQMHSANLATIIYTSGTTGEPKGVMLTHDNFTNQHTTLDDRFDVTPKDSSLCFLPLSHVYERSWSIYLFSMGACNTILADPKTVIEALAEVKPTVMVSAPRLYDKIHAAIMAQVLKAPAFRQKIFHFALRAGYEYWTAYYSDVEPSMGLRFRYYLGNTIVLKKLRAILGGDKQFLSSGGAPLDKSVEEFFFSIGLLICQGYGLTETSPMLTCNAPFAFKFGTVGRPINDVELKISADGEILAKGPNVTQGYFRNEQATNDCFTDGWFNTGDIGHLDEDGYLVITDRMKDLIITAGGKNIAPQRIETLVGKDHYIDQLAVFGDRKKYITAIIVPAIENITHFAQEQGISFLSIEDLVTKDEIIEFYRQRIEQNSSDLSKFEKIQKFVLIPKPFDQERGEITPTLKVRRRVIAEHYIDFLEQMYAESEE